MDPFETANEETKGVIRSGSQVQDRTGRYFNHITGYGEGRLSKDVTGERFHDSTKHRRGDTFPVGKKVASFKVYASPLETVRLAAPKLKAGPGLWNVIAARRAQGPEVGASVTTAELSQLLWATQGLLEPSQQRTGAGVRTVPSPSGSHPLEVYVLARNVADTFMGVYHYAVREHQLEQVQLGDPGTDLQSALLGDEGVEVAALALVFTGIVERAVNTHGERGYRHLYLEAGTAAQNALLAATALGLSARTSVTFYDDELAYLIGLNGAREVPLCVVLVGR